MKIDRLIGILAILLQREKVTAPFLADKFEVSRRTINRDIEDLCKAGVPIVTTQGQNGGITIMDGYRMDRTILTSSDMQSILAGLKSLDSVAGTNRYQQLMEKLSVGGSSMLTANNNIVIDLASWYKTSLAPKIELIQEAIERCELISFCYYAPKGESERTIEPYLLVFQWASWYVWGYCLDKSGFRLFKLNRMLELKTKGEVFACRELPEFKVKQQMRYPDEIRVTALFEADMKWRLIEEYGVESFTERNDGRLLFESDFMDKENIFTWILSFGRRVQLLTPEDLRDEFKSLAKDIAEKYES